MSTSDTTQAARRPWLGTAAVVAPVIAALIAGGGIVYALDRHGSSAAGTAATVATPAGVQDGGGGIAGEQRIQGTLTAKSGSSITVKTASGTATYTVVSSTDIVRNGQAAGLADVRVGDPVFAHVYPSASGALLVERLFAGTSAHDAGPGGRFGPPTAGPRTTTTPPTHI